MKYVRRKRDAACFNSESFERPISQKPCECTEQDWECDVGYDRADHSRGNCVPQAGVQINNYNAPDTCKDYYAVTQGYRKVAGNRCEGGINRAAI